MTIVNGSAQQENGSALRTFLARARRTAEGIPYVLLAVMARGAIASIFWNSGRTKVEGFALRDETFFLFEHEYALPLIDHRLAAYLATFAEHLFPVLLLLGLATRLSALALLGMTITIQIFVYPEAWQTHGLWAVSLLLLIKLGPGRLSLDHWLARPAGKPEAFLDGHLH